jgi:hypothetical protein
MMWVTASPPLGQPSHHAWSFQIVTSNVSLGRGLLGVRTLLRLPVLLVHPLEAIKQGDDPLVNVQPSGTMFSEAVEAWLSDGGRELRPSTMHDYRGVAKTLRGYFTGPPESIDTDAVNAFREHLLDQGLSARTTNKILTLLRGVFKLAMERQKASTNPVAVARRAKEGKKKLGQYLQPPRS